MTKTVAKPRPTIAFIPVLPKLNVLLRWAAAYAYIVGLDNRDAKQAIKPYQFPVAITDGRVCGDM